MGTLGLLYLTQQIGSHKNRGFFPERQAYLRSTCQDGLGSCLELSVKRNHFQENGGLKATLSSEQL